MNCIERLRDKANSLPRTPGVYLMKNEKGDIIYVGKAKKLKNRVTSYFVGTHENPKTARLVSLIRDFDFILCDTEIEALTLENVLIKKHTPKYNIRLKDAKSYPYIKVGAGQFPKLTVTRERRSDGGKYFGPYSGTSVAYSALETVTSAFSLPTCKRVFPSDIGKERPCIYKEMGKCVAPCTGEISSKDYLSLIKCAEKVLGGDVKEAVDSITRQMTLFAEREEFEKAAALRDKIFALRELKEKQKVVSDEKINRDVFALYYGEGISTLATLTVRDGSLINKNEFTLGGLITPASQDVISLIADYYEGNGNIPKEILIEGLEEEDLELLSEYLTLLCGKRTEVRSPQRGSGKALCSMAYENAKEAARQSLLKEEREDRGLTRLAELLSIPVPKRIEAYDISNIGDECIRASMIVYKDGRLSKADYRSFRIGTTDGADDYGSMREALTRRLSHIGDGTPSLGESPDLILLDGGEGHVGVGKEVLSALGITVPLFGMVKDDYHKTRAITDGERDISIATEMGAYTFVYNLQEEAHRFAVKMSSAEKRKTLTTSTLEKIKGIGKSKAKVLLKWKRLSEIKTASVDELSSVKGITRRDALAIFEYYHKEK